MNAITVFPPALCDMLERVGDPRVGLLTEITEEPPSREALGICLAHTLLSPPTYFRANRPAVRKTVDMGAGAGFDRTTACWSAIGEAVERYAASLYWREDIVTATADELGDEAHDMARLIRSGRPDIHAFDPRLERGWTRAIDMVSGRAVFVPAAITYLGYDRTADHEAIGQNDSTGLACAASMEDASVRALCEVVERDAFISNWLLTRRPPRIVPGDHIAALAAPVRAALTNARLSVRVFHLAQAFGVHAVMCVVSGRPGFGVIGACASPSIVRAIEKAVIEGLQGWAAVPMLCDRPAKAVEDLTTPADHLRYYLDADRFKSVADWCAGSTVVDLAELLAVKARPADSHAIATAMAREGIRPALVDLTTSDVRDLGLVVVRAVVPGLQPLVFGPHCGAVPDQRRLDHWRRVWGLSGRTTNPHPHPFP